MLLLSIKLFRWNKQKYQKSVRESMIIYMKILFCFSCKVCSLLKTSRKFTLSALTINISLKWFSSKYLCWHQQRLGENHRKLLFTNAAWKYLPTLFLLTKSLETWYGWPWACFIWNYISHDLWFRISSDVGVKGKIRETVFFK